MSLFELEKILRVQSQMVDMEIKKDPTDAELYREAWRITVKDVKEALIRTLEATKNE